MMHINRRFIELVPVLVDLGAKPYTFCWTGFRA
jgi:hypothetical protein